MVPEPTVTQTMMILHGLRDTFGRYKVNITEDIIAAAELSDRYAARFADKAIDLLDQAAARKLSATARPVAVQELESELHQLRREQDYVASRKQYDKTAELGKRIEAKEMNSSSSRNGNASAPRATPKSRASMSRDRLALLAFRSTS